MSQTSPVPDYLPPPEFEGRLARRPQRVWLHVVLFLATLASTLFVGIGYDLSFRSVLGERISVAGYTLWDYARAGLPFSATLLGILGIHELGHYVMCRRYGVDATLPYFIPFPFGSLLGTLGAVIKIRSPIRNKRVLFDVGVAGPIAGFAVAVPALLIGLGRSTRMVVPPDFHGIVFGEPLIFKMASWLVLGRLPAGIDINLHPIGFAAWFGMFATALNLLPIGQLDGGHVAYSVFGRRSWWISLGMLLVLVPLGVLFSGIWLFWAVIALMLGLRHFSTLDEAVPLDRRRRLLALLALAIFVVTFIPAPIKPTP